ncbi:MAG: GldG family protein, partial [Pseudomonadales bacterium]|nr:GldG family protein [Pseudomonadales bacterium]
MNTKSLFSSAGLVVIALALIFAVAVISLLPGWRIDLTEDNLYSLSDGTRNIVASLEHPIELMFFYSDSAIEDLPQIRSYGTRVQELLREIVSASNGRLSMSVIDPEPFSEDEDLATQYGIQAVPVTQGGAAIYFGLVVIQNNVDGDNPFALPVMQTMPLIRPDQEQFLEYEFLKLITRVGNPDVPVVGLLTELDIDGGFNPIMGQATQQWMVMDFIRQLYEVRRVDIAAADIDEDIDILMIVHPQDLSQQMLYAID